jgi:PIN domain nuclease of toxin-antitoxin system
MTRPAGSGESGNRRPDQRALVSSATVWEIAIKRSLGKLTAPDDLPAQLPGQGFGWLPISADHAWEARRLPLHHRDPFDRLLVAQALVERIAIVTGDPRFSAYGVIARW